MTLPRRSTSPSTSTSALRRRFAPGLPGVAAAVLVVATAATAHAEIKIERDVEFLEPGRQEKLDLYLPPSPAAAGKGSPALVWIHGGGWMGGTKGENRAKEVCTTLAEAGYVTVSIDYKLGRGAWPQNLQDCKNAVRFLRARAERYGVDPQRIAVAGGSAGGHLALMVAFTTGQPALEPAAPYPGVSSSVRCVIDMYGITNILTRRKTEPSGRPTAESNLGGALGVYGAADANAPVLRLGSPVTHVTPASPPVLILHGRADATVDYLQAEELAAMLARHRVPHELILLDDVGHTFAFRTWGKKKLARDLTPTVLDFLAKHMR